MRRLPCLLLGTLLLLACGDDDGGGGTGPSGLAPAVTNGASLSDIQTHWSSQGTSGAYLYISLLEDGTGQLNFGNDAFYGSLSRQLLQCEWSAERRNDIEVTVTLPDESLLRFTMENITGTTEGGSMSTVIRDQDGALVAFSFTLMTGPPSCC